MCVSPGPSCESVFIRDCSNCVITVACKQLRTRDCVDCVFYLYSLTDPIIETSTRCQFAPFNGAYKGIADHFRKAHLEADNNHWKNVFDFNEDEDSDRLPKPHWTLLPESEWVDWHVTVDGVAADPNPVDKTNAAPPAKAIDGGGAHVATFVLSLCANASLSRSVAGGVTMSFDIRHTSQEAASAAVAAMEEVDDAPAAPVPAPAAAVATATATAPKSKYAAIGSDSAPKSKYAALGSDSAPKSKYAALGSDGGGRSKYAALGSDGGGAAAAPAPKFTAPDGTVFSTRSAMRQYTFKTMYTFENRTNEKGLMKKPGDIDG